MYKDICTIDTKLFGRLINPAHCLYPILPGNNKSYDFLLSKKGIHLPSRTVAYKNLYKNCFLRRCLFNFGPPRVTPSRG